MKNVLRLALTLGILAPEVVHAQTERADPAEKIRLVHFCPMRDQLFWQKPSESDEDFARRSAHPSAVVGGDAHVDSIRARLNIWRKQIYEKRSPSPTEIEKNYLEEIRVVARERQATFSAEVEKCETALRLNPKHILALQLLPNAQRFKGIYAARVAILDARLKMLDEK